MRLMPSPRLAAFYDPRWPEGVFRDEPDPELLLDILTSALEVGFGPPPPDSREPGRGR